MRWVCVRIKEDVHYTLKDRLGRFAMSGAPSSSRLPYDCHVPTRYLCTNQPVSRVQGAVKF